MRERVGTVVRCLIDAAVGVHVVEIVAVVNQQETVVERGVAPSHLEAVIADGCLVASGIIDGSEVGRLWLGGHGKAFAIGEEVVADFGHALAVHGPQVVVEALLGHDEIALVAARHGDEVIFGRNKPLHHLCLGIADAQQGEEYGRESFHSVYVS